MGYDEGVMQMRGKVIPFPQRPADPERRGGFVEVRRCDRAEAVVVRSLLESEGIPVVLHSRIAHSVHPFTVGAQGEIVVMVPAEALPRTRRLLV
jgi:hypothetical protein